MEMLNSQKAHFLTGEGHSEVMAGVYHNGIMYYDFSTVKYINNSGVADLIDLVKSWIELGTDVRFLNVNEEIQKKFKDHGIDEVLYCE
jgi:anti-anti-sigma regulatory factor